MSDIAIFIWVLLSSISTNGFRVLLELTVELLTSLFTYYLLHGCIDSYKITGCWAIDTVGQDVKCKRIHDNRICAA